ncbi:MAG: MFS transporter [Burkholderiaceae bacterium]|jgi:MFS family permease
MLNASTRLLLNVGHAIDHMFLLIFATAVTRIAADFGVARWEDLMPYSVAAFFFFGLGSLPAGKLGDQWGRRPMMLVFFAGMGVAALLVSVSQSPLQMALALALLGCFAAIYHPVGIPMLVQGAERPGRTIGINGLAGNLGIAAAAVVTGFFVKYFGWRAAFAVPGVVCLVCGVLFAMVAPREMQAPAKKKVSSAAPAGVSLARLFLVMTLASTTGSLVFNFSTSSNYEMLASRLQSMASDPAQLGLLLAAVYAAASVTQLVVGHLLDRHALKTLYLGVIALQAVFIALAIVSNGWVFYLLQFLFMATIFGAVPFTDAMLVRFVDDSMRSRVAGMRLAVSLGASSLAVWLIGPVVKQAGFTALLTLMAATSLLTLAVVSQLPRTPRPVPLPRTA